ncbi:hypothetical protein [Streptomyces fructofermentans]|uniref:Uncharacterized protein n=1 Tax=Streptomyces fructofermentans TaxID=152141 RepID=A0A918K688_9ACTN|nr:hypothetical protein [Streptomyces fructofermentans]GGX51319.1 hypothetical protein GCM10010515_18110 [Streptomyces fructofermentans]
MSEYCGTDDSAARAAAAAPGAAEARDARAEGVRAGDGADGGPPFAECVLCRRPTEHPESHRGVTLCPVCEWQEAQRTACSG